MLAPNLLRRSDEQVVVWSLDVVLPLLQPHLVGRLLAPQERAVAQVVRLHGQAVSAQLATRNKPPCDEKKARQRVCAKKGIDHAEG